MNRDQTRALVDVWDDLEIALKFVDVDIDEVDAIVRDEGDDIETLTGEPGWVEITLMLQGSGPVFIMDPRGKLHVESYANVGAGDEPEVVHCKPAMKKGKAGHDIITHEVIA